MKMETNIVYQEDCIEGMKKIPNNSIDLVLTDPPYNKTNRNEWDKPIDLKKWWVEIKRISKPNTAIIVFSSQPFTTDLINSNRQVFKYVLVWDKKNVSNPLNAKVMPLVYHEDICIFYEKKPVYNPQKTNPENKRKWKQYASSKNFGEVKTDSEGFVEGKYPRSILVFSNANRNGLHPTQKPVELFKYLIKTYSNENQLVLDCFGGSGTTAIACIETNRQYILFENNPQYFKIINDRIQSAKSQTLLSQPSAEGSLIGIKLNKGAKQ